MARDTSDAGLYCSFLSVSFKFYMSFLTPNDNIKQALISGTLWTPPPLNEEEEGLCARVAFLRGTEDVMSTIFQNVDSRVCGELAALYRGEVDIQIVTSMVKSNRSLKKVQYWCHFIMFLMWFV